jgi:hypothetical protein
VWSVRARVADVDLETRLVTLVNVGGEKWTFRADEAVRNLPQVRVGDEVVGERIESLAIEVREPTPEEQSAPASLGEALAAAQPGQRPAGLYVRQLRELFTIAEIDRAAGGGMLRDPAGELRFVKVRDPSVLDRVKVGDTVVVTYSEALRLEVVAAP